MMSSVKPPMKPSTRISRRGRGPGGTRARFVVADLGGAFRAAAQPRPFCVRSRHGQRRRPFGPTRPLRRTDPRRCYILCEATVAGGAGQADRGPRDLRGEETSPLAGVEACDRRPEASPAPVIEFAGLLIAGETRRRRIAVGPALSVRGRESRAPVRLDRVEERAGRSQGDNPVGGIATADPRRHDRAGLGAAREKCEAGDDGGAHPVGPLRELLGERLPAASGSGKPSLNKRLTRSQPAGCSRRASPLR